MSNSVVEAILSSTGIAYNVGKKVADDFHSISHLFVKNKNGYFAIRIKEEFLHGVDYGVIVIETTDAQSYDACDNNINDIDVGYVVMSESSYRPENEHTITEFAQLVIEHSKGKLTITDSEDQSGILMLSSRNRL